MNLFEILKGLQEFRSTLEAWGLTSGILWTAGFIALVCLAFSTREVLGWYLRTNQLRDEVKALRRQIDQLQTALDKTLNKLSELKPESEAKDEEAEKSTSKPFRFPYWRNSL